MGKKKSGKRNVTIRLDRETLKKVKVIAARQSASISDLLAQRIEILAAEGQGYELAHRQAIVLLEQGFHLGGGIRIRRDELH